MSGFTWISEGLLEDAAQYADVVVRRDLETAVVPLANDLRFFKDRDGAVGLAILEVLRMREK